MKKFFVSAFVMCAMTMTSVSFAQETAKNECPTIEGKECAAPKCDMAKELNLTPEQEAKMKEAHEELAKARKESREDMKAAREKHKETIDQILTPEQKAKMKEMGKKRHGNKDMRHHRGHKGHKHHGTRCDSAKCEKPCAKMNGECMKGEKPCAKMNGECKKGEKPCAKINGECKKGEKPCAKKNEECKNGACPQ